MESTVLARVLPAGVDRVAASAAAAPLVAAVVLAGYDGGRHVASWGVAGVCLLVLLAIVAARVGPDVGGRLGAVAVGGWLGLAAWQGLSALWADEAAAAVEAMNRTILYGSAFTLVLLGLRRSGWLGHLTAGALLAVAVVSAWAVGARLLPALIGGDENARLSTPVPYWNSLGALMAFGAVLSVALGADPARGRVGRAWAASLAPLFLLGLLLTASRGAAVAAAVGFLLVLVLAPGRLETALVLVGTTTASLPLLAFVNGEERLSVVSGPIPEHAAEGRSAALLLLLTMIVCGLVGMLLGRLPERVTARPRRLLAAALAAAALAGAGVVAVAYAPEGGPSAWSDRAIAALRDERPPRVEPTSGAERLTLTSAFGRTDLWRISAREFRSAPLLGTGAGDFRFRWASERPSVSEAVNAHSLYLEVLGESGLVGVILLLCPFVASATAVALALRRNAAGALRRDLTVAVAASAVIGLHMALDWDWQLPATVLPAIVLAAGALKAASLSGGARAAPPRSPWRTSTAMVLCALAAVLVASPAVSEALVDRASGQLTRGDSAAALSSARAAALVGPLEPRAPLLRARAYAALGRPGDSENALAEAIDRSPRDWHVRAETAAMRLERDDLDGARAALGEALRLNPREPDLAVLESRLLLSEASRRAADGNLDAALRLSREAALRDPLSARPPLLEAKVLARLGRGRASDDAFRRALGWDQDSWSIRVDFAEALLRRDRPGDRRAAQLLLEEARQIAPDEPRVVAALTRSGDEG